MPDRREKGLYSRYVSECNEAGDEEMVDVIHYVYGVGVAQPQSELHMRSRSCAATIGVACGVGVAQPRSELHVRSWEWVVPLHHPPSRE
jgi:hypothetical protein